MKVFPRQMFGFQSSLCVGSPCRRDVVALSGSVRRRSRKDLEILTLEPIKRSCPLLLRVSQGDGHCEK